MDGFVNAPEKRVLPGLSGVPALPRLQGHHPTYMINA
jgi:hypothetical protein